MWPSDWFSQVADQHIPGLTYTNRNVLTRCSEPRERPSATNSNSNGNNADTALIPTSQGTSTNLPGTVMDRTNLDGKVKFKKVLEKHRAAIRARSLSSTSSTAKGE